MYGRSHKRKSEIAKARTKPGGSNAGEYTKKADGPFAGPAGGAPKGTYPLGKGGKFDVRRAAAAIAYSRHAPNPKGIKRYVAVQAAAHGYKNLASRIRSNLNRG